MNHLAAVQIQLHNRLGTPGLPAIPTFIQGDQIRPEDISGKAVFRHLNSGNQIQAEKGQIGKVIVAEGLSLQMGMD